MLVRPSSPPEIVTARLGDGGVPPESIQARKTEHSRSSRNRGLFARSAFFRGLSWSFAWEGLPLTRSHRVRLPRPGSRKTYDEMSRYGDSRRLAAQSGGPVQNELTLREMVNGISALFAVMTPDGAVEDVNHAVLDYFGKTLEELKQWASTDAVHPDDLPGVIAVWSRSLESGEPYDLELRQRGADSVYRWFRVQGLPVRDADGRILRWCVLQTDIDERKRAEGLLAGENLVLKMTAKGSSLESILETVCRIVEQTATGCRCSALLFDLSGSTIQQALAPSLPSSYSSRFPGTPVDREGGRCTAAA